MPNTNISTNLTSESFKDVLYWTQTTSKKHIPQVIYN